MKEINIKDKKILIRQANRGDAKALIDYLNIIGGESNFLTFSAGQFGKTVEEEENYIENVLKKENDLFLVAESNGEIIGKLGVIGPTRMKYDKITSIMEYLANNISRSYAIEDSQVKK